MSRSYLVHWWNVLSVHFEACSFSPKWGKKGCWVWESESNVWQLLAAFWQLLANLGKVWQIFVTFGNFWQLLATLANSCQLLAAFATFGNPLQPLATQFKYLSSSFLIVWGRYVCLCHSVFSCFSILYIPFTYIQLVNWILSRSPLLKGTAANSKFTSSQLVNF